MGKSLAQGGDDLIGDITQVSKDVINNLQRQKKIDDDEIEENDWWKERIDKLKINKQLAFKIKGGFSVFGV